MNRSKPTMRLAASSALIYLEVFNRCTRSADIRLSTAQFTPISRGTPPNLTPKFSP